MINFLKKSRLLLFFKSPVYNFFFVRHTENNIHHHPESLWRGNKEAGKKIIDGFLNFHGESVSLDNEVWNKNHGSKSWNEYLNSFMWIKDIRAVGTNKARIFLRNKLIEWTLRSNYWDSEIWEINVLAKRIFNLLTNLSFFYETANEDFQKRIANSINKQCLLLLKKAKNQKKPENNIFVVKSIILSSLCFNNLRNQYQHSLNLLKYLIKNDILNDGMHYLRSPSEHFFFLCSLIDIKNFLGNLEKEIPIEVNEKIQELASVLKFFRISDGQLSIFNKFDFIDVKKIENVLKKANCKLKVPTTLKSSGFHRVSKNKLTFIMDCGKPSSKKTHAGSLSFEFSHFSQKIVVNSGSPYVNHKEWNDAMRSTAAHSTLNIDEINSSDIFFDKDTTTRIADVWSERIEKNDSVWINSAHSGYKKIFGIIHKRSIHIDSNNLIVRGAESFYESREKSQKIPSKYFIIFHIHPSIELNATTSKKKVVLKLKNNVGWEFICSEAKIEIGEGIYLGGGRSVHKNNHILIKDSFSSDKKIKWLFRLLK
ncbi:MAG: heparinase II/III family protein [Pseudomonadota bacterium]|nr:heparinase II/III family protein [Pseudomonadota bacterium]